MPSKILLVDDSATTRTIIKVYLTGLPCTFTEAGSAEQALEQLKIDLPNLLIADINMPGLGGMELVRQLRASTRPRFREVPVIFLTGDKTDAVREAALAIGANAVIHKPVTSAVLRAELVRLLPELAPAR